MTWVITVRLIVLWVKIYGLYVNSSRLELPAGLGWSKGTFCEYILALNSNNLLYTSLLCWKFIFLTGNMTIISISGDAIHFSESVQKSFGLNFSNWCGLISSLCEKFCSKWSHVDQTQYITHILSDNLWILPPVEFLIYATGYIYI